MCYIEISQTASWPKAKPGTRPKEATRKAKWRGVAQDIQTPDTNPKRGGWRSYGQTLAPGYSLPLDGDHAKHGGLRHGQAHTRA